MKRIHLLLLFMCLIFVVPSNVRALTGSIKLDCPESVTLGTANVSCTVKGTSSDVVTGLSFKVSVSGGASIEKIIKTSDIWYQVNYDKGQVDAIPEVTDISGSFDIGTLSIKLPNGGSGTVTISIDEVMFGDKDYNDVTNGITGSSTNITIIKKDNDTSNNENDTVVNNSSNINDDTGKVNNDIEKVYLDNIIIEGYQLDFVKDIYDYVLTIGDETSLNISPVSANESIEYSISGNSNLTNGSVIAINVTSDTSEATYTIKILKENAVVTTGKEKKNYVKMTFLVIIGLLIIINALRVLLRSRKRGMEHDKEN